ncbi:hypothetical protein BD289DRAFT_102889 [Coniella lustricola]|uniref:Uncharacterized protein n=1 Tax=Coniella lustricola TaxID=2025994 RepID=A0A2T2ZY07_9PEZI|nr:hypothetical protein BD289DRAFT_102889 [Coniella lustricola]
MKLAARGWQTARKTPGKAMSLPFPSFAGPTSSICPIATCCLAAICSGAMPHVSSLLDPSDRICLGPTRPRPINALCKVSVFEASIWNVIPREAVLERHFRQLPRLLADGQKPDLERIVGPTRLLSSIDAIPIQLRTPACPSAGSGSIFVKASVAATRANPDRDYQTPALLDKSVILFGLAC